MATTGYCVKCKEKREIQGEKTIEMKGKGGMKRSAITGVCPTCGTKMFRIMGKVTK
jgi:hypothetical protein